MYIDEHSNDRQMAALPAIIGGRSGGFPGWVNECFAGGRQSRGVERAKITYEIAPDLGHWGVEIVGKVKAWAKAISGPTSPPGKYPQLMNAPGRGVAGSSRPVATWFPCPASHVEGPSTRPAAAPCSGLNSRHGCEEPQNPAGDPKPTAGFRMNQQMPKYTGDSRIRRTRSTRTKM
jgi:hypothetical protein